MALQSRVDIGGRERVPSRIKSFSRRGGRMVRQYEDLLAERGPEFVIDIAAGDTPTTIASDAVVDLTKEFRREAPLVVEIGPGSGEQLVSYATTHPEHNILAIEAWHPGVARCVANAVRGGVNNVRLVEGDCAQILPVMFGLRSAGEEDPARVRELGPERDAENPNSANPRAAMMWTFFPDPWRKARHRKRRLVSAPFAGIAAGVLAPGGLWRMATDWDDYAWQMRDEVEASRYFDNLCAGERPDANDPDGARGGFAPRWDGRLMTRFEERGLEAGRSVHDVTAVRRELGSGEGELDPGTNEPDAGKKD